MIEILSPGLLTTVQDAGRYGWQKYGVPVSGAMDGWSLAVANLLAGNAPAEGALEITALGPTLRFSQPVAFALAGGDFPAQLDGCPLEMGRAYSARAGSTLQIGAARTGFRCYLAVNGGFALPSVMGSVSTYQKGGFGGCQGRPLQKGDRLPLREPQFWLNAMERRQCPMPRWDPNPIIRVIPGPQEDCFSPRGLRTFYQGTYTIGPDSDRMGYRLRGPAIQRREGFDGNILSDGVAMGSIQVPDDTPLIMMADRQTTGGYAKIATAITQDLPALAQCRPGDTLRFAAVTMEEAQALARAHARFLRGLAHALELPEGLW